MGIAAAVIGAAVLGAGTSIYSAKKSEKAAEEAADEQKKALELEAEEQAKADKLVAEETALADEATNERRARLSSGRKGLLYEGNETGVTTTSDTLGG